MAEEMSVAKPQSVSRQAARAGQAKPGRRSRRALAALGTVVAAFALVSSSALAASTHPYKEEWSTGANCNPREVATDSAGNVYVACAAAGLNGKSGSIRKFSPTGVPVSFTASKPYIAGNEINEDPGSGGLECSFGCSEGESGEFGSQIYLDVDSSPTSPRQGYIYASTYPSGGSGGSGNVEIFNPSGEYVTSILAGEGNVATAGVGIDQNGFIYVQYAGNGGRSHTSKFNPANFQEVRRILPSLDDDDYFGPCCTRVRPDNTGAVWVTWGGPLFDGGGKGMGKYEADQFNTNLHTGFNKNAGAVLGHTSPYLIEAFEPGTCQESYKGNLFAEPYPCSVPGATYDVDLGNNDLYAISQDRQKVVPFSPGVAGDPVHQNGPTFGSGQLEGTGQGVAIDNSANVYVTKEPNKVVKFEKGDILPTVTTKAEAISDIGHTTATVRGLIDPAGGGQIESCQVKWGKTTAYSEPPVVCSPAAPYPDGSTKEVNAVVSGLTVGKTYHYRYEAANAKGNNFGGDRTFEAKAVLSLATKPATEIDQTKATLNGQLDTDGLETEYFYEFGPESNYGLSTAVTTVNGNPGELLPTPFALTHLQRGHTYHYRLVGRNSLGTTKGLDQALRTASPPEIAGIGAENVADTSADIHAAINPVGYESEYRFEYGTDPEYGQSLPLSGNQIGDGTSPVTVSAHLSGLPTGVTIHYRVVASNKWGTSESDDTTFDFRPPSCPNAHVRQLTGSSYLPDCRAYELVSPEYAGAVQLMPGEGLENFAETFGGLAQSGQNFGYASSPSRFVYTGALGSIQGIDAPNSLIDIYLATRTNHGWETTLPGLKGNEALYTYGRACSDSQDLCVDHPGPFYAAGPKGELTEVDKSASPYLYKADGTRLGRLPTNVGVIKGGTQFHGDEELSGDFSHFFLSTRTPFTPDGRSTSPGSVYDNDIGAKTVSVISKLPGGEDIPVQPSVSGDPTRVTGIAGESTNGSRVLLAGTTSAACNVNQYPFECPYMLASPARLYMRVGNAVTYDVSRGEEVYFGGMTKNASKVLFTTAKALDAADTDTSLDMYMWEEQGDKLTLVSQEGSLGNSDACSASWTPKCGVQILTPEKQVGSLYYELVARVPGLDDELARDSGDIFFYSPEDLVAGEVGGDGQRNLYLYHHGHLRLVTTFEPNTEVERITISADGAHAAFMTKATLTAYKSNLHREVYTYDAETGALRCASCNPSGVAPTQPPEGVSVSEAGPFMVDDGRTFFATKESLVPEDTDGIRDIYEYAGGRPRLISSGTGNRESTGGLELLSAFFGDLQTSLESVSRDGTDVYFSTFDTLVPQDQNGSFLKMDAARSGGGFDQIPNLESCAAADECHGVGSAPPVPAEVGTGGSLGATGNLAPPKHKKKKRHRTRHRRSHRSQRSHRNG